MKMKLNCDLGELDNGVDQFVMPYIDMANIACGFHAGNENLMQQTLDIAKQHKVEVGAHPGYQDKANFGRLSMALTEQEIINLVVYQLAALEGLAIVNGQTISYVKPHGALYNDMMASDAVFIAIIKAMASYQDSLPLMILATASNEHYQAIADKYQVKLLFEAFADRRYTDQGRLTPRTEQGAVLDKAQTLAQAKLLAEQGLVITNNGKQLELCADTLCVHGDNQESVELIKELRALCHH